MSKYMVISLYSTEGVENLEISPEMIQAIIEKYNTWNEKVRQSGKLIEVRKLTDQPGKRIRGIADKQAITDGPFIETKEVVGGYWIIEAKSYDEILACCNDCPSLELGGFLEIREVEELPY